MSERVQKLFERLFPQFNLSILTYAGTMNLKIGVVIPYYNQQRYLRECLESVVNQVFTDWIAIVVDDASHQECEEVVKSFQDSRIIVVHHEVNKGLAAARNTGVRFANTEWVLPLDADDRLSPLFLAQTVPVIFQFPEVDAVFTDHLYFGEINSVKKRYVQTAEEILDHHSIPGAGTLFKRKVWENAGGYCEHPVFRFGNEDWDFWISVYENGVNTHHVGESLYFYRRYANSMVGRLQAVDYKVRLLIYKRHRTLFDKYHMRNKFLSNGFENSAIFFSKKGMHLKTSILASMGFALNPNNRKLAKLAINSVACMLNLSRFINFKV